VGDGVSFFTLTLKSQTLTPALSLREREKSKFALNLASPRSICPLSLGERVRVRGPSPHKPSFSLHF